MEAQEGSNSKARESAEDSKLNKLRPWGSLTRGREAEIPSKSTWFSPLCVVLGTEPSKEGYAIKTSPSKTEEIGRQQMCKFNHRNPKGHRSSVI